MPPPSPRSRPARSVDLHCVPQAERCAKEAKWSARARAWQGFNPRFRSPETGVISHTARVRGPRAWPLLLSCDASAAAFCRVLYLSGTVSAPCQSNGPCFIPQCYLPPALVLYRPNLCLEAGVARRCSSSLRLLLGERGARTTRISCIQLSTCTEPRLTFDRSETAP